MMFIRENTLNWTEFIINSFPIHNEVKRDGNELVYLKLIIFSLQANLVAIDNRIKSTYGDKFFS